jgi:putative hydroxymethylpyrimidine transport system substrate-binding protein
MSLATRIRSPHPLVLALVAVLAALAVTVTACGAKEGGPGAASGTEPREVKVALDWYANPDHAGFVFARDQGMFESAGLDVQLDEPTDPALPLKLVETGEADLAISYQPELLLARGRGSEAVAIASLVNRPLTSMIWLRRSGVKRVADLEGEVISTAGIPYQRAYLKTILGRAGLSESDVKIVSVGQSLLPSIVSGRAKATLGPFWNIEGVTLKLNRKAPEINPVNRLGVPSYDELVLIANRKRLEEDPESICLFMGALARGTTQAGEQPNLATDLLLEANPGLDRRQTAAQMRATLPLLAATEPGQPFGYLNSVKWQTFIEWMVDNELLDSRLSAVSAIDNEFLPGNCLEGV